MKDLQRTVSNQRRELRRVLNQNEMLADDLITMTSAKFFYETQAEHLGETLNMVRRHFKKVAHEHSMFKGGCVFCGRSRLEIIKYQRENHCGVCGALVTDGKCCLACGTEKKSGVRADG